MPLTRKQAKLHANARQLLELDELTYDQKYDVYDHFHEGGDSNNKLDGAHFTPVGLARDFALDVGGTTIIDLCAGIGVLGFAYLHIHHHQRQPNIVCVEINPAYVEVGRKVLPEAEWICGDIFDEELQRQLEKRQFDTAIGNPPFGKFSTRGRKAPRYQGSLFEYAALDIGDRLAEDGAFIIPQSSSPYRYSGVPFMQDLRRPLPGDRLDGNATKTLRDYERFAAETGIDLQPTVGVDTSTYRSFWRGVAPTVEIVTFTKEDRHVAVDATSPSEPAAAAEQLSLL